MSPRHLALALGLAGALVSAAPAAGADRAALQRTELISRAADGGVPDGASGQAVISGDKRYARTIAYTSTATNIVPGDVNGMADVFAVRRGGRVDNVGGPWQAASTVLVSRGLDGQPANGPSSSPAVDGAFRAPGRCVAFLSAASNLVRGDTNGRVDAFLATRPGAPVRRLALPRGAQPRADATRVAVAGDCSRVAWVAGGRLYVTTTRGGRTVALRTPGPADDPSWAQGRTNDLVFGAQVAGRSQIFLARNGTRRPRQVTAGQGAANPAYNGIKNHVLAYETVRDGRRQVAFRCVGPCERRFGARGERWASARHGQLGNGDSSAPVIGNSGYYVSFASAASNLGTNALGRAGDGNGQPDAYLYTAVRALTLVQSVLEKSVPVPGGGAEPSMSYYANYVLFSSPSPLGGLGAPQVYMRYLGPV